MHDIMAASRMAGAQIGIAELRERRHLAVAGEWGFYEKDAVRSPSSTSLWDVKPKRYRGSYEYHLTARHSECITPYRQLVRLPRLDGCGGEPLFRHPGSLRSIVRNEKRASRT